MKLLTPMGFHDEPDRKHGVDKQDVSEYILVTSRYTEVSFRMTPLSRGATLQGLHPRSRWFGKRPFGHKLEIILVKICKDATYISSQP